MISPQKAQLVEAFFDAWFKVLSRCVGVRDPPGRYVPTELHEAAHGRASTRIEEFGFPWHTRDLFCR
jgi:gentisate 1,2-dioxygenase